MNLRRLCLLLILGGGVLARSGVPAGAAEPVKPVGNVIGDDPAKDAVPDESVQIKGIFNSELPRTERKNFLRLIVHPHFGDFHRKDYLRVPVGLRYGLTHNWEVSAAVEGYFAHGLGSVAAFSEYGLSAFDVGTKYRSPWTPLPGWEMATGLDYTLPLDHPPLELTDGLAHTQPYVTFARDFPAWHGVRLFWGTGLDLVRTTSVAGQLDTNDFGDDANTLTAGFVWPRGRHTYTFESTFATTALIGDTTQNRITVRPGLIFELPPKWTFHSRGQWILGVAVPVTEGPDGLEVGLSVKLRGNFNLKRLLGRGGDKVK